MKVYSCVSNSFEIYPITGFCRDAKNQPPNKDFVRFCLKFDPLNTFDSKELEKTFTKPLLFPRKMAF